MGLHELPWWFMRCINKPYWLTTVQNTMSVHGIPWIFMHCTRNSKNSLAPMKGHHWPWFFMECYHQPQSFIIIHGLSWVSMRSGCNFCGALWSFWHAVSWTLVSIHGSPWSSVEHRWHRYPWDECLSCSLMEVCELWQFVMKSPTVIITQGVVTCAISDIGMPVRGEGV